MIFYQGLILPYYSNGYSWSVALHPENLSLFLCLGKQMSRSSGLLCNMQQVPSLHPYNKGSPPSVVYISRVDYCVSVFHVKIVTVDQRTNKCVWKLLLKCSGFLPPKPNGAFARSLPIMSFSLSSLCITPLIDFKSFKAEVYFVVR